MRISMEPQLISQETSSYETRLLFVMDLERNQLKLSLTHPTTQYIP